MGSLGKHGTYKTIGNRKKKTLTLPFSWQSMGKNLENILSIDNSVNKKDLSICGSSGEEFFNNCEVLQCGFSVPRRTYVLDIRYVLVTNVRRYFLLYPN